MDSPPDGFSHLSAAWTRGAGLATLRDGFAWDAAHDRLFALGWPHVRALVDGHPDDADPVAAVHTAIDGSLEGHYQVRWPRQVALRYVRAYGGREAGAFTTRRPYVAAAASNGALPVDEGEARLMLRDRVRRGGPTSAWFVEHFVLLLEALVGAEVVLDGLTEAFEGEVGTDEEIHALAYAVGFLLLRVDDAFATPRRARLGAVLAGAKPGSYLFDALACSLGGGAAAREMGRNPDFYHHAVDDPEAVVAAVRAGKWLPSARLAFIGGDAVLEAALPHWKKQKDAELQRKLVAGLVPIRSRRIPPLLAEMAAKSRIKKELPEVCAPFAAELRPGLEALTGDPALGDGARALLARLA